MMLQYRCPVPDCQYQAMMVSTLHYENVHGMMKKDIIEKYGQPERITSRTVSVRKK